MERIFIQTDEARRNRTLDQVNAASAALTEINDALNEILPAKLDKDLALRFASEGIDLYVREIVKTEETKLKKLSLPKMSIKSLVAELEDSLRVSLDSPVAVLKQNKSALQYFEFYKSGSPFITEESNIILNESFNIYADTPDKIEFYHMHKEVADKFNALKEKANRVFGIRFMSSSHAFNSLFEGGIFNLSGDDNDDLKPKPINYGVFFNAPVDPLPSAFTEQEIESIINDDLE